MIPSAMLSVILLVSMSINIVDHMAFAQAQQNTSTTSGVIDNVNLTETLIEEAKDVYANATEAAKQVANKTQETVQAVANTTKEAVNETSLFISNASQNASDDDIRANVTQASKSIRTESEDSLRALITETRDILNNLTGSVRQFLGGN